MFVVTQSNGGAEERFLLDSAGKKSGDLPRLTDTDWLSFHEGLLRISSCQGPLAYVDHFGAFAVPFGKYTDGKDFSCGLASVCYMDKETRLSGFIDRTGEMVIGPFKDVDLTSFENNLAVVTERTSKTQTKAGVIDTQGKFVIPMSYETIWRSLDNKFLAMQNGHYYLIDRAERKVISFSEGCDDVRMKPHLTSETLIPCGFGGTRGDKYVFKRGSKWGYCDSSGRMVIEPKFAYCDDFVGDMAVAYVDSTDDDVLCGVINRSGEWVLPAEFCVVNIVSANRFIVRRPPTLDEAWKNGSKRWESFGEYLRLHDFIGMSKQQLLEVFADGMTIAPYDKKNSEDWAESIDLDLTPGASCGNASAHVLFGLDKSGKVFGWRIAGGVGAAYSWVRENVVLQNKHDGLGLTNLVPKLN